MEKHLEMEEWYNIVLNGDHIPDHELAKTMAWFEDTANRLYCLGPHFHLAWKEAHRVASFLEEVYRSRLRRGRNTNTQIIQKCVETEWPDLGLGQN